MDWVNVTKIHTHPHLSNAIPPDEHALYKDNFATGNGELHSRSQSLRVKVFFCSRGQRNGRFFFNDILRQVALGDEKSTVKHATWSNSCHL